MNVVLCKIRIRQLVRENHQVTWKMRIYAFLWVILVQFGPRNPKSEGNTLSPLRVSVYDVMMTS